MLLSLLFLCVIAALSYPVLAMDIDYYGSLRLQAEYVQPDNLPGNFGDYLGLRDAFSIVGVTLTQSISDGWSAKFEAAYPLDMGNLKVQDTWTQDVGKPGVLKIELSSPLGTL